MHRQLYNISNLILCILDKEFSGDCCIRNGMYYIPDMVCQVCCIFADIMHASYYGACIDNYATFKLNFMHF